MKMYNECYKELEQIINEHAVNKRSFTLIVKKGGSVVLTPTKNLHEDKTIIKIGARILSILTSPSTVSSAWNSYIQVQKKETNNTIRIQFDTFILALDFLYIIGAIEYEDDLMWRVKNDKENLQHIKHV
ncbi:ABC-three component system middle component 6 [Brevibacillus parabrevis]|uniref:ABC-three component system middle component 6 n=1 Tax=Brevibacillus parabrevis TaxID=54914 RepID=UPI0028D735B1|nr:ABC-three component system middle component 6 [Brevibacillus parabrevis]